MAYTTRNFKTKQELLEAVERGERVSVQPDPITEKIPDGTVFLEGPHYPEPHRWYAEAVVKQGVVVRVKK